MAKTNDFQVTVAPMSNLCWVRAVSKRAKKWIEENVQYEPWQSTGLGIAVDVRYFEGMLDGMRNDGLQVNL